MYEDEHGPIAGPGALLELLIRDEAFAWLRPVSARAADELAEAEEIPPAELSAVVRAAAKLLSPTKPSRAGTSWRCTDRPTS